MGDKKITQFFENFLRLEKYPVEKIKQVTNRFLLLVNLMKLTTQKQLNSKKYKNFVNLIFITKFLF